MITRSQITVLPLGEDRTDERAYRRTVVTEPYGSSCVQRFSGDIDLRTVGGFEAVLGAIAPEGVRSVVLDLSRVSFLGVSALKVLRRFIDEAARGQTTVAVACTRGVAHSLEVFGLDERADVFSSFEDAWACHGTDSDCS